LFVIRHVLSTPISLSRSTTSNIAWYKSHHSAVLLTNKSLKVAGWTARLLIFSGVNSYGEQLLYQRLEVVKGRVGYYIDMDSNLDGATADKALFKQFYLTFKPT
jgi:hypothetical protein